MSRVVAHLIKLLDAECQKQFSLYIISVYVQVVYAEADGTKTMSVMDKDPNTHKTDVILFKKVKNVNKKMS